MTTYSGQKTLAAYTTGLFLCLLLTFAAFGVVYNHTLPKTYLYGILVALAVMQLLVQCICFLRLNISEEGRSYSLPFLFAMGIIFILVGGSLWIMYNLNLNMM